MKKIVFVIVLGLSFAMTALNSCTNNYYNVPDTKESVSKEVLQAVDTVKYLKQIANLKRKLSYQKRVNKINKRNNDSLTAENIRKDGIIGDEKMFPKMIFDTLNFEPL